MSNDGAPQFQDLKGEATNLQIVGYTSVDYRTVWYAKPSVQYTKSLSDSDLPDSPLILSRNEGRR